MERSGTTALGKFFWGGVELIDMLRDGWFVDTLAFKITMGQMTPRERNLLLRRGQRGYIALRAPGTLTWTIRRHMKNDIRSLDAQHTAGVKRLTELSRQLDIRTRPVGASSASY